MNPSPYPRKPNILILLLRFFLSVVTAASFTTLPSAAGTPEAVASRGEAGLKNEGGVSGRQVVVPPTAIDRTSGCDPWTEEACLNPHTSAASSLLFREMKALVLV